MWYVVCPIPHKYINYGSHLCGRRKSTVVLYQRPYATCNVFRAEHVVFWLPPPSSSSLTLSRFFTPRLFIYLFGSVFVITLRRYPDFLLLDYLFIYLVCLFFMIMGVSCLCRVFSAFFFRLFSFSFFLLFIIIFLYFFCLLLLLLLLLIILVELL